MGAARRPQDQPRNPFRGGRVLQSTDIRVIEKQKRFARMRLALETISKLDVAFEDPADAANAAVRIATEALK